MGLSMALSVGPFEGGQLCVYHGDNEGHIPNPAGEWHVFDGHLPHHVLPYAGERLACIAYTHALAFTSQAKNFADVLSGQGFPIPPDFGVTKATPVAAAPAESLLQKAAMA